MHFGKLHFAKKHSSAASTADLVLLRWNGIHARKLPTPLGLALLAIGLFSLGPLSPAHGDVFYLANGAQVRGHWVNRDDRSPEHLVMQTAATAGSSAS